MQMYDLRLIAEVSTLKKAISNKHIARPMTNDQKKNQATSLL